MAPLANGNKILIPKIVIAKRLECVEIDSRTSVTKTRGVARSKKVGWTRMASAGSPQRGPGAEPLVRGSEAKPP